MFETMAETVGFAMHVDRLAKATRNLRLVEAEQGGVGRAVVRKRAGMTVRTVAGRQYRQIVEPGRAGL